MPSRQGSAEGGDALAGVQPLNAPPHELVVEEGVDLQAENNVVPDSFIRRSNRVIRKPVRYAP